MHGYLDRPGRRHWATAANWSPEEVPNSADTVCIGTGKTVNVSAGANEAGVLAVEGTLAISGGSLALSEVPSTVSTLQILGGTLESAGEIYVSKSLVASGGSMTGAGSTVIGTEATGKVESGGNLKLVKRTLIIAGSLTVEGPSGKITGEEGAAIKNSGTLTVNGEGAGNGLAAGAGATPTLTNTGTLRKSAGAGTTTIAFQIDNESTVNIETGTLKLVGGGSSGIEKKDTWTTSEAAGIVFSGGAFSLGQEEFLLGHFEVVAGAQLTVGRNDPLSEFKERAYFTVTGSTLNVSGPSKVRAVFYELTTNEATITVSGGIEALFNEQHMEHSKATVGSNSHGFFDGGTMKETKIIGEEYADVAVSGFVEKSEIKLADHNGINYADGEFKNTTLTTGNGTTVNNSGAELAVFTNSTVEFGENTTNYEFSGGIGPCWLKNTNVTLGNNSITSIMGTLEGGTFSIGSNVSLNMFTTIAGDKLTVGSGSILTNHIVLESGSISGAGAMTLSEFTWTGGELSGSGVTELTEGGSLGKLGKALQLKERRLITRGLVPLKSGTLVMTDGAVLENLGEFAANSEDTSSGAQIKIGESSATDPKIINKKEFNKESGAGTTEVTVPFENKASIGRFSGTLRITRPIGVPPSERFGPHCHCGDPVDVASGDFTEQQTDIAVGGRGVGLNLSRSYSSMAAVEALSPGAFGYGWTNSFDDRLVLEEEGKEITLARGNGSTVPFAETSKETFSPQAWSLDKLTGSVEKGFVLTLPDSTKYSFSAAGRLESVVDRNGNKTTLAYDEAGRLKTITDPASRQITLAYNAEGLVESAKDPMGHIVKYGYEGKELTSVTMPGEGSPRWRFKYDGSRRMTTITDGRGGETVNEYDSSNRVVSQTDPAKRTLTFEYEAFHTKVTNKATGAISDEWFTSDNEPFKITSGFGTASATTRTFSYNDASQLASKTDGNGHKTEYGYDAEGNRTSEKNALGDESKWSYNTSHQLISVTTPKGEKTTITHDGQGNLEKVERPAPGSLTQTTSYTYNVHGELESKSDPLGHVWKYEYNGQGDLSAEIDPEGDKRTWTYNEDSRPTAVVSPRGNEEGAEPSKFTTILEYDPQGRIVEVADPLLHTTKYGYDANGNVETETDANGHTTTYSYNADDDLIKVKQPNGTITETEYDGAGEIKAEIDGNKHRTEYVRNVLEQPIEVVDPLARKTTRKYDAVGNLLSKTDPEKRTTSYVYNAADRLKEVTYSDGKTPTATFGYDKDNNLTSITDGTGTTSYEYDQLDRLTKIKHGHGDTVSYEYNLGEQQTSIIYPNGKTVTQGFDKAGRMTNVGDWLGNTTSFAYDRDSDINATVFPKGTSNVDEYAYDRADRMSEVKLMKGAAVLASLVYSRDKVGQVEGVTAKGLPGEASEALAYDENDRLAKGGTEAFEYGAADNLTKTPTARYTYDAANELEQSTGATFTYDKVGERTKEVPFRIPVYSTQLGSLGSENGQLKNPSGIVIDSGGNVWVADSGNNRVEKFSAEGKYLSKFGSAGSKKGQLSSPAGVAIDSGGHIWVADSGNNRVQEFSTEGKFLSQLGSLGSENGQLKNPSGIAIDSGGNVWVADSGNNRVEKFSEAGKFLSKFGETGAGNGQFKGPSGIEIDASGRIWVADKENHRVQEFSEAGKFLSKFGETGSGNGQFKGPTGIGIDASGRVWVVDTGNNRVQEFNEGGEYLTRFGEAGAGNGQFSSPADIAFSGESTAWITDTANNRVERLQLLERSTTYKYDQAGDLIGVERPSAGEVPAISESYAYDGTGLRISKTVSGTTKYLTWSQSAELPFLLSDGDNSYIYGPDGFPVEQISAEGTSTYVHHDQLGSTRILTSSSGEVTGTFGYGAYGAFKAKTGTGTTPFGFAGQYTDSQSGLQYLRARVYDPATGQFLTRDPIEALTGQPYAYALDNPTNGSDPSGRVVGEGVGACALTWEVPGAGEASCGVGAAEVAAGIAALVGSALTSDQQEGLEEQLTLTQAEEEYEEEHHECPLDAQQRAEELNKELGVAKDELIAAANFVDQLLNAEGSNPNSPRPGNSSKLKFVVALLLRLLSQFIKH
jgi:RHS repeat-associated protein